MKVGRNSFKPVSPVSPLVHLCRRRSSGVPGQPRALMTQCTVCTRAQLWLSAMLQLRDSYGTIEFFCCACNINHAAFVMWDWVPWRMIKWDPSSGIYHSSSERTFLYPWKSWRWFWGFTGPPGSIHHLIYYILFCYFFVFILHLL